MSSTVHSVMITFVEDVEGGEHGHVNKTVVEEADKMADETWEYPLVTDEGYNSERH